MNNAHPTIETQVKNVIDTIERENRRFRLVYIDYRDSLTDDQIAEYIDVGHVDSIYESYGYEDARWEGVKYAADELLEEFEVTDSEEELVTFDDLDYDVQDELRFAIEDRDDSDPEKDLIRNTPNRLFRVWLGGGIDPVGFDYYDPDELALDLIQSVEGLLPTPENLRAARTILAEQAYWGGSLVALVYSDIETMRALTERGGTITDPSIWLYDSLNGTAFGEDMAGEIVVAPRSVGLDRGSYSIDGICGLDWGAFSNDPVPNDEVAKAS